MRHAELKRASRVSRTAEEILIFGLIVFLATAGTVSLGQVPEGAAPANKLVVSADKGAETINRNIYGHFAEHLGRCIYDGFWVGEDSSIPNTRGIRNDVVAALRAIKIPVLRWPGGCFADTYHWKDGVGPRDKRPPIVNVFWGGVTEKNEFGTHEFLDLCEQLGCEPYICGNVGSGTVRELQEWVEYTTFDGDGPMSNLRRQNGRDKPWKVKYWGIGNENWGCGGRMRPEFYADQYRRFSTYVRGYGNNNVFRIACGANSRNFEWTRVLMLQAGKSMQGLAFHYYCGSGTRKKLAAEFDEADWFAQLQRALRMNELVVTHSEIMEEYDPEKKVDVICDEWGTWHRTEPGTNRRFLYQQNTLHDALVAGVTLNIFNNHCDRVKMANIAQTVNVLQAMILTEGPKMILTPTYHVYEMYKVHHDATMLPIELRCDDYTFGEEKIPSLSASASKDSAGKIHISLCNMDPKRDAAVSCELKGAKESRVSGRVLTSDDINAHNTFDKPRTIEPLVFPAVKLKGDELTVTLPAKSVVVLEVE